MKHVVLKFVRRKVHLYRLHQIMITCLPPMVNIMKRYKTHNKIEEIIKWVKGEENLIILGSFNATMGEERDGKVLWFRNKK